MRPRSCVLRVLACAVVAFGVCTATASAGTVSFEGGTVVFTGTDGLPHDVQFRISSDLAHDEIYDSQPIALDVSAQADCVVDPLLNSHVTCPGHASVRVDLGAANDSVTLRLDCFDSFTVNLGEGANSFNGSDNGCGTIGTGTVNGGAAHDDLGGGTDNETLNGGGGDDTINGGSGNDVLHGGPGNDRLYGDAGNDQLLGEDGNDDLAGGAGDDSLDGGIGNDRLEYSIGLAGNDQGVGADTYTGGSGTDELWFDRHANDMAISINGVADDGNAGEGDNVGSDIESIDGTAGNDVFTGSAGPDGFSGGFGNDEIHGGGGPDQLYGGGGDDKIYGDAGDDKVEGANGSDTVDGGPGVDQIYGDIGSCSFSCSSDADTLYAADGEKDAVDCGGGADTAHVDQLDVVAFCASVDRQSVGAPPGSNPAPGPSSPAFTVTISGGAGVAKGVGATVACPAACSFSVSIVLSAKTARKYGLRQEGGDHRHGARNAPERGEEDGQGPSVGQGQAQAQAGEEADRDTEGQRQGRLREDHDADEGRDAQAVGRAGRFSPSRPTGCDSTRPTRHRCGRRGR